MINLSKGEKGENEEKTPFSPHIKQRSKKCPKNLQ